MAFAGRQDADDVVVTGILASTYGSLERQIAEALKGVARDRIVSINYCFSRLVTVVLQHHAVVAVRRA